MPNPPAPPPTLFCLHFLGGSAREWGVVQRLLGPTVIAVPFDLPGFGSAVDNPRTSIEGMVEFIADQIAALSPPQWWIAGHSMGAKVALAIARRAEDGDRKLQGFEGLVLLAGSPPSPEPMSDDKRRDMVTWISADAETRIRKAGEFIDRNTGAPLSPDVKAEAVADVLRADPKAWIAWLEAGSRENWRHRIGVLHAPALVLSGSRDADLGPAAQVCLMLPHLANAWHAVLEGAGHLLPIECPEAVANLIREKVARPLGDPKKDGPVPQTYDALIGSSRVNTRLRAALRARADLPGRGYRPRVLDPVELSILRALVDRILPGETGSLQDIGARIEMRLAEGAGDGWRFADLPPDVEAYSTALSMVDASARSAHEVGFVALADETKDALIASLSAGRLPTTEGAFDGGQMAKWFEDLRSDVVRIYLAHPVSLARLGFSGIGAGGDDIADLKGFSEMRIGIRESWEPAADREIVR